MNTKKVLVVDDSPVNRKIIVCALKEKLKMIETVEAGNGLEALEVLGSQPISVVLLDIMMPVKDGLETLQEIKSEPSLRDIPVIMCTALNETQNIESALSLGALDYFTKPLTSEQIKITLPLKVKNALDYYEQKRQLVKFYDHIKEEMQLAEELQKSMIANYLSFNEVEIWGRYIPCEEIGGDFFVSKEVGGKVWLMMADVSGHGVAAAMLSTMLNVLFNVSISQSSTPGLVLQKMNQTLVDIFKKSKYGLVSVFVACVEGNRLTFANAGHPYPVLSRSTSNEVIELNNNGLLLGVLDNVTYETFESPFTSGDSLVLYTDGLFDDGKDGGFANWSLVKEYLALHQVAFNNSPVQGLEDLIEYFKSRQDLSFVDDAAVMVVCKN